MGKFKTIDDIEKEEKERQVKEIQNFLKKGFMDYKKQREEEKRNRPLKDKILINIFKGLGILFFLALLIIVFGGATLIIKYLIT